MSRLTQEELIQIARQHYPEGFPLEQEDPNEHPPAYQRTPEFQRWMEAWDRAMRWKELGRLLDRMRQVFGEENIGGGTQPRMSACCRCQVYFREPLSTGGRHVTRVAAAVSILAPVYLVYVTTKTIWSRGHSSPAQLFLHPPEEMKPHAQKLAGLVEETLGYQPFPLELAEVPLPGLRILDLYGRTPTLLDALLDELHEFTNLP